MHPILVKILVQLGILTAQYIGEVLIKELAQYLKEKKIEIPSFLVETAVDDYIKKNKTKKQNYRDIKTAVKNQDLTWVFHDIIKSNKNLDTFFNKKFTRK